jgi:hypothetical protein
MHLALNHATLLPLANCGRCVRVCRASSLPVMRLHQLMTFCDGTCRLKPVFYGLGQCVHVHVDGGACRCWWAWLRMAYRC